MAAPPPYQIPVYQQRATTDTFAPGYLQDFYGTGTMPFQEWVRLVQTGERTITPGNPDDDANMAILQSQQPGEQSFGDMMKGLAPSIAGYTAGAAYDVFTDPYLKGGSFLDKVGRSATSLLPDSIPLTNIELAQELPSKAIDRSIRDAGRLSGGQASRGALPTSAIPAGYEVIPELSTPYAATQANRSADLARLTAGPARPAVTFRSAEPARAAIPEAEFGPWRIPAQPARAAIPERLATPAFEPGRPLYPGRPVGPENPMIFPAGTSALNPSVAGVTALGPNERPSLGSDLGDYFGSGDAAMRAGVTGLASFGTALLTGQDPATAARAAVGGTVGGYVGGFFGPIGSMIGSALGASLTRKRVICNELVRQGLMSREHMMLDYKFTKEHLTPQHVRGYHFWAVPVVRKMREGKSVGFWRHIATHRANEIAHIYGKRDKPDYLGKVYRRIFEPACWLVGAICKQKDWQSLYSTKGI